MAKARKDYNVDEVLSLLRRKHDCRVTGKRVEILNGQGEKPANRQNDLGNGTHGKIDYLVNHCGYSRSYVGKFS